MIFLTVLSVLLMPFCVIADSRNLDSTTVADAFYQGVNVFPTLDSLFDTTISAEDFYLASLHALQDVGVPNAISQAKHVKQTVKRIFPKINTDVNKKLVASGIANFLVDHGMVNEDNLHKLVDQFISILQRGLIKANGNHALLAMGGFNGIISFLKSSGALNSNNADDFMKPFVHSYFVAAGENSSFEDSSSDI